MRDDLVVLARYNRWMNKRLYSVAASLPVEEVMRDRGAFFGSIFATLNHIMVADLLWLHRFARADDSDHEIDPIRAMTQPTQLDQPLHGSLAALAVQRELIDSIIQRWIASLAEARLAAPITYTNIQGAAFTRRLSFLLIHFFNHQTHHRGQVTTLLSQAGVDVGVTDLALMLAEPE